MVIWASKVVKLIVSLSLKIEDFRLEGAATRCEEQLGDNNGFEWLLHITSFPLMSFFALFELRESMHLHAETETLSTLLGWLVRKSTA